MSLIQLKEQPISPVELVVGITSLPERAALKGVLSQLGKSFNDSNLMARTVILCPDNGGEPSSCRQIEENPFQSVVCFQNPSGNGRKANGVQVCLEVASALGADFLLFNYEPEAAASPKGSGTEGDLFQNWAKLLYEPVQNGDADVMLPRLQQDPFENCVALHLTYPLVSSLYNMELRADLTSSLAIKSTLVNRLLPHLPALVEEAGDFAVESWLLLNALALDALVGEVFIGHKSASQPRDLAQSLGENALVLFKHLCDNPQHWEDRPAAIGAPLTFGQRTNYIHLDEADRKNFNISGFRKGYYHFYEPVWARIFSEELLAEIDMLPRASNLTDFHFPTPLWTRIVYETLLAFKFDTTIDKRDLTQSLAVLFQGRMMAFINDVQNFSVCGQQKVCPPGLDTSLIASHILKQQTDTFLSHKPHFVSAWKTKKDITSPFLPEIAYWEYLPGVPILLPHLVRAPWGHTAHVAPIYEELLKEYKEEFFAQAKETLGLSPDSSIGYEVLAARIEDFVTKLEKSLADVIPGDMGTVSGTREMVSNLFSLLPQQPVSYSLTTEAAARILRENPPVNLLTRWSCTNFTELLEHCDPLDALAAATWSEGEGYISSVNQWIIEKITPADFEVSPVKPLVVDHRDFPSLVETRDAPVLSHLTSRIVINTQQKGTGGKFPRLRYFTALLKNTIEAEEFGSAWQQFASNQREFGRRVVNSITGHWGLKTFSAHFIFENFQQRILVDRLREIGQKLEEEGSIGAKQLSLYLNQAAATYHLGLTLPEGQFATFCIWSWASYSSQGGRGYPTPLSLTIERFWFSTELFLRCYEMVGGSRTDLMSLITKLMAEGSEAEDLAVSLLNTPEEEKERILVYHKLPKDLPPSGQLQRSIHNPILSPVPENEWESKYVLNCGAIRLGGAAHIFYRAVGKENISTIGLAVTEDGHTIKERYPEPVFVPADPSEEKGCEDPRLVRIDDRVYMLYTAYDGKIPQIALASIDVDDLLNRRWQHWHRHGLAFPGITNKDAVLFPEKFGGNYAMYHRIAPSIWVAYTETLDCPLPRKGHKIVMGTRSGLMWDAIKLGAGATPLKTKYGWLHIYHGVDYLLTYRLGVFLTALDDPSQVIYRAPNPCLEPEESFEQGIPGQSWVPNVVFTCGAVPTKDKDILEDGDEILVYYGGADTVIGMASVTLEELLPTKFLKSMGS